MKLILKLISRSILTMIKKTVRFTIPEYREKKEIYQILGYKEIGYRELGTRVFVTFEVDETYKHYKQLAKIERSINVKGPIFLPIILFVFGAFVLLSIFVVLMAASVRDGTKFDLTGNALAFLLPAFMLLFADVVYTYFYFKIHHRLMERGTPSVEEIKFRVDEIKSH